METTIHPDGGSTKHTIILIVVLVLGFGAGYLFGSRIEKQNAEVKIQELQSVVNTIYPAPVGEVKAVNGVITAISGDTLTLDIPSLTQTYPKPGQSIPRQQIKVTVTKDTKITQLILDPKAKLTTVTKDKLTTGDTIYVTVADDLLKTSETQALTIQKNVYPTAPIGIQKKIKTQ